MYINTKNEILVHRAAGIIEGLALSMHEGNVRTAIFSALEMLDEAISAENNKGD